MSVANMKARSGKRKLEKNNEDAFKLEPKILKLKMFFWDLKASNLEEKKTKKKT